MNFYILDVFAESKFAGNQLAVFRHPQSLTGTDMQKIAREMNFSESTFILSEEEKNGGYDVRIFTPEEEVPFAGHPTLGTAFIIQNEIIRKPVDQVTLNLKVGQITVSFNYDGDQPGILWMRQKPPQFGAEFDADQIAGVLNLDPGDIDSRFPIMEVSTGLPFIIAPLNNLETVKRARINRDKYFDMVSSTDAKAILLFSDETCDPENDLNARMFADYYGVPEDPATGSANGCLAGYLVKYNYFGDKEIDIRVEQGYEMGRPSILYLRAYESDGQIEVNVGGKVVKVASGEFFSMPQ